MSVTWQSSARRDIIIVGVTADGGEFCQKGECMSKIVIAVDRGHFKAYRVTKNPFESERVDLVNSFDTLEGHERIGDVLTDQAGSFGLQGGKGGVKGYGEPHNIETEVEKRTSRQIARMIGDVIVKEKCKTWYLAAPQAINSQIVEYLDQPVREKMEKNVSANLTKVAKSEIMEYFRE